MKPIAAISGVLVVLLIAGCTPPYFGVSLRFQRADVPTLLDEVRTVAGEFDFAAEAIAPGPRNTDWQVLLRMRAKQIVRREALSLMVVLDRGRLSVGVGRRGGLGLSMKPEEVALVRAISTKLKKLQGFEAVDREIGMKLVDDTSKMPNQTPQRNAGSRPSSDDSPASGTSSSLGPRG